MATFGLRRVRRSKTAWVRRTPYERDGVVVRGAWHFAPGAKVYVQPPFSGDGGERVYMIGKHRETDRWTRVIGPRARLRGFHVEEVIDPIALDLLGNCDTWEDIPRNREWLEQIHAASLEPRRFPWPDSSWSAAVERAWTPDRPSLVADVARVLRCDESRVESWQRDSTLGARLNAIELGRWKPEGTDPLRRVEEVWELLAPAEWIDHPARRFAQAKHTDGPEELTSRPYGLASAVSFASDVAGVTAAEELVREVARALGKGAVHTVVWRIGTLAAAQGFLERVTAAQDRASDPVGRTLRLVRAAARDDDDLAAWITREDPVTVSRVWLAALELVSRGYVLAALGDGRAEVLATEPSRARMRDDAW